MKKFRHQNKPIQKKENTANVKFFFYSGAFLIAFLILYIIGQSIPYLIAKPKPKTNIQKTNYNKLIEFNDKLTSCTKNVITKAATRQKITRPPVVPEDPQLGSQNAEVTIIEYSNFDCSYCANVQSVLNDILIKYPDKIKLVWKNLPIKQIYPNSEIAAMAALCAGNQDKFWEYHDLLFANQDKFSKDFFIELAESINLDIKKFSECINNGDMLPVIQRTMLEAEDLNITGTPHFYINEQEIMGAGDLKNFIKIIEIELVN